MDAMLTLFGKSRCLLICLFFSLMACADRENVIAVTDISEGVINPSERPTGEVEGEILWQNAGPRVVFVPDTAYIQETEEGIYRFQITFLEGDSLSLLIERGEWDYNYHFPDDTVVNKLISVIFNEDTLTLTESALSVQPIEIENSFLTITNVHTETMGDWNGTIKQVPLIK